MPFVKSYPHILDWGFSSMPALDKPTRPIGQVQIAVEQVFWKSSCPNPASRIFFSINPSKIQQHTHITYHSKVGQVFFCCQAMGRLQTTSKVLVKTLSNRLISELHIIVLHQGSTLTFFHGGPFGPPKSSFFIFWWPDCEIWWPEK